MSFCRRSRRGFVRAGVWLLRTVTGEGRYDVGVGVTVSAVPAVGYHFANWTEASSNVSGVATYEFTATTTRNRTAHFAIDTYPVAFAAGADGTLTGSTSQFVTHGANATAVTAVADGGYHFVRWRLGAAEYGTATSLTVTNVTADMTLTAEFAFGVVTHTVTFVAGSGGRIDGQAVQVVLHEGETTAVTATALSGFVFTQWSDGLTANRRTVTHVLADHTHTAPFRAANAVPPSGSFLAVVGAAEVGTDRGLWDLTGTYVTAIAGSPLTMRLVHEPTGRLGGTATYSVGKATSLTLPIKGSAKGARGSVTMKCAIEGASADKAVTVALTLALTVDAVGRQLTGRMGGTVKANRVTTEIDDPLVLTLPAPMDGTRTLRLQLGQDGRTVTGTALLTLANGVGHAFVVQGRTRTAEAVLSLAGDPADPVSKAITIRATLTPLEGGWARLETLSGRGYGQTVGW